MSLHIAAKHLASKGRDGDSTLVHMSPGEVEGLQALAMAHGGSLSVNPDTGLVEAGFLKDILPVIAGAGLNAIFPGSAALIGLGVGGTTALATGDINKGLMAGLGAYGGAGLASSFMGTAASAAAPTATGITAGAVPAATTAAAPTALGSTAGMTGASNVLAGGSLAAPGASTIGISAAPGASSTLGSLAMPATSPTLAAAPSVTGSQIAKYGLAAAAPVLSGMVPEVPMPGMPEEDPRYGGAPYKYNLASNFTGYVPNRPNPYYRPTGLGYAAGGDVMMAANGTYEDEPMGDDFAMGGSIGGYSDGGRMLKGPGDGMSDDIPATIGNKQPARLADGEFVVPADVVSHLGNGSTDAGAKKLYGMMDKVRKARTGTKKQGKQIKPEKYMPA
jgi:hypothetical protein